MSCQNGSNPKYLIFAFSVALDNHMGVAILRTRDLMDYSGVIAGEEEMDTLAMPASKNHADLARVESGLSGEFFFNF